MDIKEQNELYTQYCRSLSDIMNIIYKMQDELINLREKSDSLLINAPHLMDQQKYERVKDVKKSIEEAMEEFSTLYHINYI